jgi:RNA polymerase sigma factor (sigma-70 family)
MTKLLNLPFKIGKKPVLKDNLGLAYSAALTFVQPRKIAVEDSEEYADALEALWIACDKWDENLGAFSTYAHHCMRNAIVNGIKRRSHQVPTIAIKDEEKVLAKEQSDVNKDVDSLIESLFADVSTDIPTECRTKAEKNKRDKYVLFQFYMNNATWEELGKQFGVSKNRAFQYGQRAIRLIKKNLKNKQIVRSE